MRISDWSSDVCSSDLLVAGLEYGVSDERRRGYENFIGERLGVYGALRRDEDNRVSARDAYVQADWQPADRWRVNLGVRHSEVRFTSDDRYITGDNPDDSGRLRYSRSSPVARSEEHTSELQSLMRISYAVFCLKKKILY